MKQRWTWALHQIRKKVERWKKGLFSMAGRVLIINKFIIPTIIYFLACWRPPENSLNQFYTICRNLLWSGDCADFKIPKVKREVCTLHRDRGGLGIINPIELANRLASKWIARSLIHPEEIWAKLLHRNIGKAKLSNHLQWKAVPQLTLFFSAWPVSAKGSQLVNSIWKAWNQIRGLTVFRENKEAISLLVHDSIWWPLCGRA